jgi:hypothetical protein
VRRDSVRLPQPRFGLFSSVLSRVALQVVVLVIFVRVAIDTAGWIRVVAIVIAAASLPCVAMYGLAAAVFFFSARASAPNAPADGGAKGWLGRLVVNQSHAGATDQGSLPISSDHRRRVLRGLSGRAAFWAVGLVASIVGGVDNSWPFRWGFVWVAAVSLYRLSATALFLRDAYRTAADDNVLIGHVTDSDEPSVDA